MKPAFRQDRDLMVQQPSDFGVRAGRTRVAVVIVNYRTPELACRCLESLQAERRLLTDFQVVVVDGGSGDGSAGKLEDLVTNATYRDWISFLPLYVNGGYGWANNQAIIRLLQQSNPPDFIHILNPDAEIEEGAVALLLRHLQEHPNVAAVGSQLLEPDGSLSGSAFNFPTLRGELARGARTGVVDELMNVPPVAIASPEPCEVDWVTGASFMVRVEALKQAGLFDEGFFLYHEEIELMWRLRRASWVVAFEPASRVRHLGGAATGMNSRQTPSKDYPRRPAYWYRSRSRVFALTRGRKVAALAFFLWLIGYAIWSVRRAAGLAKGAKPFSYELRDQLRYAFPRRSDGVPAVRQWSDQPNLMPTWMERGW